MPLKLPQKQKQCAVEGFLLDVRMLLQAGSQPGRQAARQADRQAGRRVGTIIIALVNGTALKVRAGARGL